MGALGSGDGQIRQLIGFELRGEHFLVDILTVREVVRLDASEITRIPNSYDYVHGLVSLRGRVTTVLNLGLRLGLAPVAPENGSHMIVVEVNGQEVGFQVDAVGGIVDLSAEQIEPIESADRWAIGIAPINGQIATVLDLHLAAG